MWGLALASCPPHVHHGGNTLHSFTFWLAWSIRFCFSLAVRSSSAWWAAWTDSSCRRKASSTLCSFSSAALWNRQTLSDETVFYTRNLQHLNTNIQINFGCVSRVIETWMCMYEQAENGDGRDLLSSDTVAYLCASVALSLSSSSKRSLESKLSFMRFTWLSSRVSRSAFSCHLLLESLNTDNKTENIRSCNINVWSAAAAVSGCSVGLG